MKTFTAMEFDRTPAKVFRAADLDGEVRINHDRYHDKIFILKAVERGKIDFEEEEKE